MYPKAETGSYVQGVWNWATRFLLPLVRHLLCWVARNLLNMSFPQQWIGRAGSLLWSPHSPDLWHLIFGYEGCWNIAFILLQFRILTSLKREFVPFFKGISRSMCERAIHAAFKCFDFCIDVVGKQVEPYVSLIRFCRRNWRTTFFAPCIYFFISYFPV